jgi:DUF1680 family protein
MHCTSSPSLAKTAVACLTLGSLAVTAGEGPMSMVFAIPSARYEFRGTLGERIRANTEGWLLRAPVASPGMLEMFRQRDRKPVPQLVPWAGEFVGKYLISAIQALRLTDDPRLEPFIAQVIAELISTQADDGYLGPFPKAERLLGQWDLWGHYHAMQALIRWYEYRGDQAALDCACRVADLMCRTYLDGPRRVHDAGSHEMNMAAIHGLGLLYRITGTERYLRLMQEIEKDWEKPPAGDYLRSGLAGTEFCRSPKPRWESLHDLQGLVELWQITGDERYRRAFVHHWTSIRNLDRHPDGGFTTGEQAVGNPYSNGAIETCCTIAWMAITVDMLRLTGDPAAADELELATWNGMLGAQHPSGRWWTYNTPINGVREASAHTIVFQSRAGTPELNCCSVNAPRGLGMLGEWGIMLSASGPVVNLYAPCEVRLELPDKTPLRLRQETAYPAEGTVRITVGLDAPREMTLSLRIPRWSASTTVAVNGARVGTPVLPGTYLPLARRWQSGDTVEVAFDMSLRHWSGELSKQGYAALYRGPLLLAFDQKFNPFDAADLPAIDLARPLTAEPTTATSRFPPIVALRLPTTGDKPVTLCDFATAGACGTEYHAWLPVRGGLPAPFYLWRPGPGARVPAGPALFAWTGYRSSSAAGRTFRLEVAETADFAKTVLRLDGISQTRAAGPAGFAPGRTYHWRVVAVNGQGETAGLDGPRSFSVDPALPPLPEAEVAAQPGFGPDALVLAAALAGSPEPQTGTLEAATDLAPAADRQGTAGKALAFNATTSRLTYRIPYFPEDDCTVLIWTCPEALPTDRLHELFSAWAAGMDDPLRIVISGQEVFARIEAGNGYGTQGVPLENGRWYALAAVKQGDQLRLYVDGQLRHTAPAPAQVFSSATNVGVGCNPNYSGNERFVGRLAGFRLYARALTEAEIARALDLVPEP